MALKTKPLAKPAPPPSPLTPDAALLGPRVSPIEHMQLMSSDVWENITCDWLYSLGLHARIEKYAGSGDQGLDVVAFESATSDEPWDSYQCKHYDHKLAPGDVWTELGKLVYHTFHGEYSVPRKHHFVAPHGPGTELSKLLHKPERVRDGLLENWDKKCRAKITSKQDVQLDDDLRKYIDGFDFGIVSAVSPHAIIADLRKAHAVFIQYFGGGITKDRDPVSPPPTEVQAFETNYVRALLDAYEHRLGMFLKAPADLTHQDLGAHFARSRQEFYSAESLREFSRDSVPAGTFESLLDDVHSGVVDVEQAQHVDAVERVLAVVKQAKALHITSNALIKVTRPADQGGMSPTRQRLPAEVAPMTTPSVLNSPVEVGLRALVLLVEASPNALDLQQLVTLDYFLVHSGDVDGGPDSLHAPSPLRSGEVTVRRELLTKGLNLYQLRGLVAQTASAAGFAYTAEEGAGSFLDAFRSAYVENLRTRAEWVIESFGLLEYGDLHQTLETSLSKWKREFAAVLPGGDDE